MTDTPNGHKATPEQWRQVANWAHFYAESCILELRDTLAALEQRVQALEGPVAAPTLRDQAPADVEEIGRHYIGPGTAERLQRIREALQEGADD